MHAVVSAQQLASRHVSHVGSPLVSPQDPGPGGPASGPPGGGPLQAAPQLVSAHVEIALSFAVPVGCADSHAETHASSAQRSAQSRSAVQSASERHAFASPQQFVSRHESHVGSPLPKPHALPGGGPPGGGPPHCEAQLDSTHLESESRRPAPVGCEDMHAEIHASSAHASPHAMSALQSGSATHALFSAQQLASRQVSQVGSPLVRPQEPPPPGPPDFRCVPGFTLALFASAEITDALRDVRLLRESFVRHAAGCTVDDGSEPPGSSMVLVSVIVQAHANVDVMAITPKILAFMLSSDGRRCVSAFPCARSCSPVHEHSSWTRKIRVP
jgi:hypothetical protein